jgi:ATP-binding cassette subfamily B protein
MDLAVEIDDRPDARSLDAQSASLRFEHVGFSFEDEEGRKEILHNIDFEVQPGQTLGIVGPPGAGKSTIAHLIPRFYDVTEGKISVGGVDICDVTLDSLRKAVNVVQQDTFMFTAAIEYNVAYGDPWADRDRIGRAADSAQLATYIDRLPRRYGTLVGERGVSLSGGQRQRLSIARSIMLQPAIIVFDDSTAAIDAVTEQRIRAALREVTRTSATIIISHRLSSLMHADEILFLEGGRIIERGTHDQLLKMGGRYHDLYTLQIRPDESAFDSLSQASDKNEAQDDRPPDVADKSTGEPER